jgi:hypothetical protein
MGEHTEEYLQREEAVQSRNESHIQVSEGSIRILRKELSTSRVNLSQSSQAKH